MKLRYLHLSDLHFQEMDINAPGWPDSALDQHRVTRDLVEYLGREAGELDFIAITGDIAQSATREQYIVAARFCERLLEATGVPKERLYMVPGNHDLDRRKVSKSQQRVYRVDKMDELDDLLRDPVQVPLLQGKFAEFNDFVHQVTGRRMFEGKESFHFYEPLDLDKGDATLRVNVLGLNSALLAGYDGDDKEKLALGMAQVDLALSQRDADAPLSIALFHHPFGCMASLDEVCESKLRTQLDLLHTGHMHRARNVCERDSSGIAVSVTAAASWHEKERPLRFSIVEVDLGNGQGRVHHHKYLDEHQDWFRDHDLNAREPDGAFPFEVEAVRERPLLPGGEGADDDGLSQIPEQAGVDGTGGSKDDASDEGQAIEPGPDEPRLQFVHDYLLPEAFVGREEWSERLTTCLEGGKDPESGRRASVVALRAVGGVGKSALARSLVDTLAKSARFERIVWFSFYEASNDDPALYFREVLARLQSGRRASEAATAMRQRLVRHLDRRPVLLVLDGLEEIQEGDLPGSALYGRLAPRHVELDRLLAHLCNPGRSAALVTSRFPLSSLAGAAGFLELGLDVLSAEAGGELLRRLGVDGSDEERERCARLFEGHALGIRALGRLLAARHIPAGDVEQVIGDPKLFVRSSEGEKLARVIESVEGDLSPEQRHFLKMMSIHARPVGEVSFGLLLPGFGEGGRDVAWAMETVCQPLVDRGLVDCTGRAPDLFYGAHPLLRGIYSGWLAPDQRRRAHRDWAEVAAQRPGSRFIIDEADREALQPLVDAVEHYQHAGDWSHAWTIFLSRRLGDRLYMVGDANAVLKLGGAFEQAASCGDWVARARDRGLLHHCMGHSYQQLERWDEYLRHVELEVQPGLRDTDANDWIMAVTGLVDSLAILGFGRRAAAILDGVDEEGGVHEEDEMSEYAHAFICSTKASVALACGRYAEAVAAAGTTLESELNGWNRVKILLKLGRALSHSDNLDPARQAFEQGLDGATVAGLVPLEAEACSALSFLALRSGEPAEARAWHDRADSLLRRLGHPSHEEPLLLLAEGQPDRAIRLAESWTSLPGEQQRHVGRETRACLVLARAHHGLGDTDQAVDSCRRARALMDEFGYWEHRDLLEETEALLGDPRELRTPASADPTSTDEEGSGEPGGSGEGLR